MESELKVSQFFPRCYDLSDKKQHDHFMEDFEQTAIMSIVKAFATEIAKDSQVVNLGKEYLIKKALFNNPKVFKQKFIERCDSIDN